MQENLDSKKWLVSSNGKLLDILKHWENSYCLRVIDKRNSSYIDSESLLEQWPILREPHIKKLVSYSAIFFKIL